MREEYTLERFFFTDKGESRLIVFAASAKRIIRHNIKEPDTAYHIKKNLEVSSK